MGGLFIVTGSDKARAKALAMRARPHFANAGLCDPLTIHTDNLLIDIYPKYRRSTPVIEHLGHGDFALAVGTFLLGGKTGLAALRAYLAQPVSSREACRGAYLLLVHRQGRTTLQADLHGVYELYVDASRSVFSTAYLALAACLPRRTIRRSECLEYVVGGVTLGTATPIAEIDRLDIGETIDFSDTQYRQIARPRLIETEREAPIDELIERNLSSLRSVMDDYVTAFGGRVRISFSGGYDSRLLFALARDRGIEPELFVYGDPDASDVRNAASLARAEGAKFEHIDKKLIRPVTLDAFPSMVRASAEMNDGFSQYWMFCSDSENYARIDRCAGDGVIMNGGGGEVFRNFFKFAGQSMSVQAFVRAFFSAYDPAGLADPGLAADYERNLSDKIIRLFGLDRPILSRAHVVALYPHLRCRSWFGRDTSLDSRFGERATPYLEPEIVRSALQVPLRWKQFGIFQGRLIKALNPQLAAHMSSHGYAFDRDPPWRARLGDVRLLMQPLALRRYNFRIKQRKGNRTNWPRELSAQFIETVIDPAFPRTAALLNPQKLTDATQFQRLAVLEYMMKGLEI
jgi:asparagine synthase (glutamine-hydrolysing)